MLPRSEYAVQKVLRECNWFQALEGDIDTSHLGFLHLGRSSPRRPTPGTFDYYKWPTAPRSTRWSTRVRHLYGAYRPAEADSYYWRIAHYLFPFFTMIPTGILGMQILVRAWVPVDDSHVMFWSIAAPRSRVGNGATGGASGLNAGGRPVASAGARPGGFEFQPDSPDCSASSALPSTRTTTI